VPRKSSEPRSGPNSRALPPGPSDRASTEEWRARLLRLDGAGTDRDCRVLRLHRDHHCGVKAGPVPATVRRPRPLSSRQHPLGLVTYTVTSSCHTNVTYTSDGGSTQQESDVPSGWSQTVAPGDFAIISAQLSCEGGSVSVSITHDGNVLKDATSQGDYVIASASTRL